MGEDFNTRLSISISTGRRRLRDNDISLHRSYSATCISDTDLDHLIRNIHSHFSRIGCQQMWAMFEADYRLRIQCCGVRMVMRRVDPAGAAILWSEVHVRRRYNVYGANALWHIDTHHSLVHWRLLVA